MTINRNILFASINIPKIDKFAALQEIESIPENMWIYDSYRNTYILPLMTNKGQHNKNSLTRLPHSSLQIKSYK